MASPKRKNAHESFRRACARLTVSTRRRVGKGQSSFKSAGQSPRPHNLEWSLLRLVGGPHRSAVKREPFRRNWCANPRAKWALTAADPPFTSPRGCALSCQVLPRCSAAGDSGAVIRPNQGRQDCSTDPSSSQHQAPRVGCAARRGCHRRPHRAAREHRALRAVRREQGALLAVRAAVGASADRRRSLRVAS